MVAERRIEPRVPAAERVTAVLSSDRLVTGILTDISTKGARLGFASFFDLPRQFAIIFALGGQRVDVYRIWQNGSIAGVQFEPTTALRLQASISRLLRVAWAA